MSSSRAGLWAVVAAFLGIILGIATSSVGLCTCPVNLDAIP